jgi:uncharacterized metal-binding protein
MATDESCACETTSVMLFPCSGGSNVGQIANTAAVELNKRGQGTLYCLAGVGGHIANMVDAAGQAEYRIAIDGCSALCAYKTLEHAGLKVDKLVVVTELGIEKNHVFELSQEDIEKVIDKVLV